MNHMRHVQYTPPFLPNSKTNAIDGKSTNRRTCGRLTKGKVSPDLHATNTHAWEDIHTYMYVYPSPLTDFGFLGV